MTFGLSAVISKSSGFTFIAMGILPLVKEPIDVPAGVTGFVSSSLVVW
jgi:hypothetical protein